LDPARNNYSVESSRRRNTNFVIRRERERPRARGFEERPFFPSVSNNGSTPPPPPDLPISHLLPPPPLPPSHRRARAPRRLIKLNRRYFENPLSNFIRRANRVTEYRATMISVALSVLTFLFSFFSFCFFFFFLFFPPFFFFPLPPRPPRHQDFYRSPSTLIIRYLVGVASLEPSFALLMEFRELSA